MKKLIPAIVMLLVSAVVLSTASYAWFTTSQSVEASGMKVTAEAPTSILIKKATDADTAYGASTAFDAAATALRPASSKTGEKFFEPSNCQDYTGAMMYQSPIAQVAGVKDDALMAVTGKAYYVDYKVTLKNTSTTESVQICLEDIVISDAGTIQNAIRIAVLDQNGLANQATGDAIYFAAKKDPSSINANDYVKYPTAAGNYNGTVLGALNAEYASGDGFATVAAGEAPTYGFVAAADTATAARPVIAELDPLADVTLTIRIWIEGQSNVCVTANASQGVTLALKFGIYAPYVATP